jgi:hypothetical protein
MPPAEPSSTCAPQTDGASPHIMQCTEVWGGNELVERGVIMTGLDVWVLSRPFEGDEEGGDIHYLSSCSTGRVARALVADVSGHGSVVAGTAKRLRTVMRRYANFINQSRLVEEVNREFVGLAKAGHFATAVVATFWGPSREIEITNAGHPLPLLYRARAGKWEAIKGEALVELVACQKGLKVMTVSPHRLKKVLGGADTWQKLENAAQNELQRWNQLKRRKYGQLPASHNPAKDRIPAMPEDSTIAPA